MRAVRERLMTEDRVEEYLNTRVKFWRGVTVKLPAMFYPGIPDRMVLLPGGRVIFIELKRPVGGKFEPFQPLWIRRLKRLGFAVYVCNTKESVDDALA